VNNLNRSKSRKIGKTTKVVRKGRKISKGSFRFKGQDYLIKKRFDKKLYTFAAGVRTKADAENLREELKKRYKSVRVTKNNVGYFVYVK